MGNSLNMNMRPFGFNVMPQNKQPKEKADPQGTVKRAAVNFLKPAVDYLERNEDVFNGKVQVAIDRINNHAMKLGMTVDGSKVRSRLDAKI